MKAFVYADRVFQQIWPCQAEFQLLRARSLQVLQGGFLEEKNDRKNAAGQRGGDGAGE